MTWVAGRLSPLGSEKSGTPWARMHIANLSDGAEAPDALVRPDPPEAPHAASAVAAPAAASKIDARRTWRRAAGVRLGMECSLDARELVRYLYATADNTAVTVLFRC